MNGKTYNNIEDFLIDNTFQSYCAGRDEQCTAYWEKYIDAHPEQQDTIDRAKRLFHILSGQKKPINQQVKKLKETLARNHHVEKRKVRFGVPTWAKVAAILFAVAIAYMWFTRNEPDRDTTAYISTAASIYQTNKGEKKKFELPDGTKVTLNAASRLELGALFNHKDRHVRLIGEAYFEVEKNKEKPFVLHTSDFDIRVIGTSFNVKSYPDETSSEAFLVEGIIEMRSNYKNENAIIIKPNQRVTISRESLSEKARKDEASKQTFKTALKEIAIQDIEEPIDDVPLPDIAWKDNRLEVVDRDFVSLERVLERWYDVDITLRGDEIMGYRFTATFSKENIEQVLQALQKVKPFKYEIHGKNVTIYQQ